MQIHTYTQPGDGSVNSYWIESETSVVIIDTQRFISSAHHILQAIQSIGKPVVAILLTHGHPDHLGGLPTFATAFPDAPILALPGTRDEMKSDPFGWIKLAKTAIGPDYPDAIPVPTHELEDGQQLKFNDIHLRVVAAGAGEANDMAMFFLGGENALFSGDVVQHRMTAFLVEGRSGAWLAQLERYASRYASATLYPGHGNVGRVSELFAQQREYLTTLRELVRQHLDENGSLPSDGRKAIVTAMTQRYPGYTRVAEVDDLEGLNTDAITHELQADVSQRQAIRDVITPYQSVLIEHREHATIISINRPEAGNLLPSWALRELLAAVREVSAHIPTPRAVILTGVGTQAFIGGLDPKELVTLTSIEGDGLSSLGQTICRELERLPMPTIAAVNGVAVGGGSEIAMSCDLTLASTVARFQQIEVLAGLLPGFGGTYRLARRVGVQRAKLMIYTAQAIDAATASEWGLVLEVVAPEKLLARATELAKIIGMNAEEAVTKAKWSINEGISLPLVAANDIERASFAALFDNDEMHARMQRVVEVRRKQDAVGG